MPVPDDEKEPDTDDDEEPDTDDDEEPDAVEEDPDDNLEGSGGGTDSDEDDMISLLLILRWI